MYKIGEVYSGFKLLEERDIKELQSIGRLFEHEKSGARLLHLESDDNNKVFSIGFKTPPTDDTGVPHILEHSVLAGSRKFRTKEPFMDMLKSSLRTFLNAMTFPDKTIYPVASRNDKDFNNLMDVYLDAVFHPRIYEVPEIFYQEGWHYELFEKDADIVYKGVVYNEMKGAYSTPESILNDAISRSLLNDTCYGYSSGGDPEFIPNLTYEQFLDFHRTLYHPANSYIFLYGNGHLDKQLKFIDENYLNEFDKIELNVEIKKQVPSGVKKEVREYYNVSPSDSLENKDYLSLNFFQGEVKDLEDSMLVDVISNVLVKSEAAPLKMELLKAGLGQDVLFVTQGGLDYVTGFTVKNSSAAKKDEFEKVIRDTLTKLVKEGIDKELLKASINILEFNVREGQNLATKGIIFKILAMEGWLYGKNPLDSFEYDKAIESLKAKVETNFFEEYIKERYLDNNNCSLVIISPKPGLAEEKEQKVKEKLAEYKASLTEEEIDELIQLNKDLKAYQLSEDSQEAKNTIPKLSLTDVERKAPEVKQTVFHEKNYTLVHNDIFTSQITYLEMYFDSSMIEFNDVPYLTILSYLLTSLNTKKRSYMDLSNAIYTSTGGIGFDVSVIVRDDYPELLPKFSASGKSTRDNIKNMLNLFSEIMFDTKIDDAQRIKELLLQLKSRLEMMMAYRGNGVASSRVASYYSQLAHYKEKLSGLDLYWFVCDILNNYDEKQNEIIEKINFVYEQVFNITNLIVGLTGDKEDLEELKKHLHIVIDKANKFRFFKEEYSLVPKKLNEGIQANYNVQYVAKGFDYKALGFEYNGALLVLSTILNGDYLHNRVRAQGGAYGVGVSFERNGNVTVASYRDPNLKETIDVYNNIAKYIEELELTEVELTQYIIGTIARLEPARTPSQQGAVETIRFISGLQQSDMQRLRNEVLDVTLDKLKSYAKLFTDGMAEGYVCVLGNENKVAENKEEFKEIVKLLK